LVDGRRPTSTVRLITAAEHRLAVPTFRREEWWHAHDPGGTSMTRRSFDVTSVTHSNPIPAVTRIGPLVMSSIIPARDPATGEVPDDVRAQLDHLFQHTGEMLAAAGADWRHVAKMTFYLPSLDLRAELNDPWVAHFPDPTSRPARHTQRSSGGYAQCDFVAYVDD
jgi:2-iminobutanoate/2-iminopropanoate deaminase